MSADIDTLTKAIAAQRVVPVIRTETVEDAIETARACAAGGMSVVELTTSTPDVHRAVRVLANEGLTVGVGTLRHRNELAAVARAGALFSVSYFTPTGFVERSLDQGLMPIPGALTPGEIQTAVSVGARVVKIFPAWQSDPRIIADLAPLVGPVDYIVTAGLTDESTLRWLEAGALAVGTGRALGTAASIGAEAVRDNVHTALLHARAAEVAR
ncbi:bifunctional 4-hydroxy-2-oxoglutarate aldolase/2-dehydro-3-deoxy-phosphogluconate aldolase [soil metagenome]